MRARTAAGNILIVGLGFVWMTGAQGPAGRAQERGLSDGIYTESQARRGGRVYRQACSSCHAQNLEGGEMGPGLLGGVFLDPWEGESLGELMALVRETMPQDNPGGLSDADYADVLAYMLQANEFPAGDQELTAETVEGVIIASGEV